MCRSFESRLEIGRPTRETSARVGVAVQRHRQNTRQGPHKKCWQALVLKRNPLAADMNAAYPLPKDSYTDTAPFAQWISDGLEAEVHQFWSLCHARSRSPPDV